MVGKGLRAGHRADDEGFALVAVMGSMIVLSLFILATLAYAVNNLPASGRDVAAKKAEAAAQAGIDEYIARLNTNDTYYTNNGSDASNTAYSGWKAIQGTGTVGAQYTYRLLTTASDTASSGVVRLMVTGRAISSGQYVSRTLTANLQRKGFLSYLYDTDIEAADPALYDTGVAANLNGNSYADDGKTVTLYYADKSKVDSICSSYYYAGRNAPTYSTGNYTQVTYAYTTDSSNKRTYAPGVTTTQAASSSAVITFTCSEIQWQTGDVVNGPLHTNDALQINGSALFRSAQTETSWADGATPAPTAGKRWWGTGTPSAGSSSTPGFNPVYAAAIPLPTTNSAVRAVADPSNSSAPGCLYAGGTKITFSGSSMTVFSPATTASNTPSRCLDVSNNQNPQVKAIPPVIYIDNASTCGAATSVGYPVSGEVTSGITTNYDCHLGNAYVSGNITGRTTIATSNDVVVTGDLTYTNGTAGSDALGLIANNYVWVYHPVKTDGSNVLSTSASVHRIDAAIFAVQHSFIVQNYNQGAVLSTATDDTTKLNVRGVIVQKFRGPVGTSGSGGTGYFKNYLYDNRLFYAPPPYFLQPTSAPWNVTKVSD